MNIEWYRLPGTSRVLFRPGVVLPRGWADTLRRLVVAQVVLLLTLVALFALTTPARADSEAPPPGEADSTPALILGGVIVVAVTGISLLALRRARFRRRWQQAFDEHKAERASTMQQADVSKTQERDGQTMRGDVPRDNAPETSV